MTDFIPAQNLVLGKGLFCRSIMKSQLASPTFSAVYAGLVAVVNTKFPEVGSMPLPFHFIRLGEVL